PADPVHTPAGQSTELDGSGWRTAELKLGIQPPGLEALRLDLGLRHETYDLRIRVLDTADWRSGAGGSLSGGSGGGTALDAAFAQLHWDLTPHWDLALGLRAESWRSRGGHYLEAQAGAAPTRVPVPSRDT